MGLEYNTEFELYSFPSLKACFGHPDMLKLFGKSSRFQDYESFFSFFEPIGMHGLGSSMNFMHALHVAADMEYPKNGHHYIQFVEDDGLVVYNFKWKMKAVDRMLANLGNWDMVFHGSCGFSAYDNPILCDDGICLHERKETRCLNGILINPRFLNKFSKVKPLDVEYMPIDHIMNRYFHMVENAKIYHTVPPLIFEASKVVDNYECS